MVKTKPLLSCTRNYP